MVEGTMAKTSWKAWTIERGINAAKIARCFEWPAGRVGAIFEPLDLYFNLWVWLGNEPKMDEVFGPLQDVL